MQQRQGRFLRPYGGRSIETIKPSVSAESGQDRPAAILIFLRFLNENLKFVSRTKPLMRELNNMYAASSTCKRLGIDDPSVNY
ncbi:hypothetical protein PRECH8_08840 [Insulibacter thermoxylanivorax]|uniref:Uncharacterized protein n=1 Tax=Insulibacter thermoxylanivorax TaxID=2749268 RepID=A0A916QDV3_9BACL|nr:hypothetical protein PRECH8_08840 [Insulibacter thermoxylanivorax]